MNQMWAMGCARWVLARVRLSLGAYLTVVRSKRRKIAPGACRNGAKLGLHHAFLWAAAGLVCVLRDVSGGLAGRRGFLIAIGLVQCWQVLKAGRMLTSLDD